MQALKNVCMRGEYPNPVKDRKSPIVFLCVCAKAMQLNTFITMLQSI